MTGPGPDRAQACTQSGFSLLEALLSVLVLGLMAATLSALYLGALRNLAGQEERILFDSALRSQLETAIATPFETLGDTTQSVVLNGQPFSIIRTVSFIDLNGDGLPEPDAKSVTLAIAERPELTLSTIVVDNEERLEKH